MFLCKAYRKFEKNLPPIDKLYIYAILCCNIHLKNKIQAMEELKLE